MNIEKKFNMYKNGKCNKDDFRGSVIEYAYEAVEKDRYIEAGDFIVDFIPRVDSIIDKYNAKLAGFPHYLNRHIKWLMFSFSRAYVKEKEKSEAYQFHNVAEFRDKICLMEEDVQYKISDHASKILSITGGKITKDSSKKRLEIFTLKNSRILNYEQIKILAPLFDRTPEWLFETKEKLNELCTKRVQNRKYLQERFNRLFLQITKEQKKLTIMDDGYDKDLLFEKILEKQKRKDNIYEKLKKRNCGPKNEEIAQILDIPKGTVDSSLFYLKKALKSLLPGLIIN